MNSYDSSMKTTVSEKGQITIPKQIRNRLGIIPGTILEISSDGGKLIGFKSEETDVFDKWRGAGRIPGYGTVDAYINEVRE